MDFSSNVDPSLQSPYSPPSTSYSSDSACLDYMASYDFDLLSGGSDFYPSMVCQTIEPSQLTDSSPYSPPYSPAPSSALVTPSSSPSPPPRSPNYTSDTS